MSEVWRPVSGWEDIYEVSDHGRVRSVDRTITQRNGVKVRWKGKLLKPTPLVPRKGGHLTVTLRMGPGKVKNLYVHRLVLEAFVGPCPPGMQACHWDDDERNNNVGNLRWATSRANKLDCSRNGNNRNLEKTHCPRGHVLARPNLVKSVERQGRRNCLACARASSARRSGNPTPMVDLSNMKYRKLMGEI